MGAPQEREIYGRLHALERFLGLRRGLKPPAAKEIKTIRGLLRTSDMPVAEIAARFGVARSTLYRWILKPAVELLPNNTCFTGIPYGS